MCLCMYVCVYMCVKCSSMSCTYHDRFILAFPILLTQLASLQSKLASLKEEKHHLFQQLKQVLHEDEQKRQLQHDQKIR